jgi:hypothetical protein
MFLFVSNAFLKIPETVAVCREICCHLELVRKLESDNRIFLDAFIKISESSCLIQKVSSGIT